MPAQLKLTRQQILAFRRRVGGLEERSPYTPASLERAAWAGLQDSMPRAALLSLHARVDRVEPTAWEHASLAQLWGPRYNTYVVARRDFALFSLGRLPEDARGRERAERMGKLMRDHLGDRRLTDREVARALGVGNAIRYAATTGTIAIRWEGARAPVVWVVEQDAIDPADARRELARRYLHVLGPTTAASFARWAGVSRRAAGETFASLEGSLLPVRSPIGDEMLLADDEEAMRAADPAASTSVRLLPSGDAYFLLDRAEREILLPKAEERAQLWTPRVWPGALLVEGEIVGTWRRANETVRIDAWTKLSAAARDAVEAEARSMPLPGLAREIEVVWET
jgi:hypothetical protein